MDDPHGNSSQLLERALDIKLVDASLRRALISPLRMLAGTLPQLAETREVRSRVLVIQPDSLLTR